MESPSPYEPPSTLESYVMPDEQRRGPMTVKEVLFTFHGRIPRRTYWLWTLVSLLVMFPVGLVAPLMKQEGAASAIATVVMIGCFVMFLWMSLAIKVKRWHDHDKSWVWILIGLIPYVGALISFIFLGCLRGTEGDNRYGEDPT